MHVPINKCKRKKKCHQKWYVLNTSNALKANIESEYIEPRWQAKQLAI